MKQKLIVGFVVALFTMTAARGQNLITDNVRFDISTAKSLQDNQQFDFVCSFVSNGGNSIDWQQNQGQQVFHYSVSSVDGSWTDTTQTGQVSYQVSGAGATGSISFAKDASGNSTVHLQLYVDGKLDQDYLFTVSSITSI